MAIGASMAGKMASNGVQSGMKWLTNGISWLAKWHQMIGKIATMTVKMAPRKVKQSFSAVKSPKHPHPLENVKVHPQRNTWRQFTSL